MQAQKAYRDLFFSAEDLKLSSDLSIWLNAALDENQMKVEIGTLAPIDVVQTKADLATRRDAFVTSTYLVTTSEDQIKKLVSAKNPINLTAEVCPERATPAGLFRHRAEPRGGGPNCSGKPAELRSAELDLKTRTSTNATLITKPCRRSTLSTGAPITKKWNRWYADPACSARIQRNQHPGWFGDAFRGCSGITTPDFRLALVLSCRSATRRRRPITPAQSRKRTVRSQDERNRTVDYMLEVQTR